ncbi:MAG: SMP-30/gluconolactonase/LRE family protein [Flavobacteriales bacterium]
MRPSFLLPLLLTCCTGNAQYNGPESVEYDAAGDRYFVSNTGSSLIKARSQAGVVTDFVSVSPAPYGLEIKGDTLFACSGGSVKGYRLSDATQVFNLNLGGTFLNGITTDGTYIYTTDFTATKIFKVDPAAGTFTTLVASTSGTPNGIVWDATGDRLVTVFWGSNAPIKAYDRNSGASTTLLANSGVGNIDGVTIDCQGNFLIASWSPNRITRFEPTFTQAGVDVGVPGLSHPADIGFDHVNDRICIPNASGNTVTLFDVDCSTGMIERTTPQIKVIPNPTTGLVSIEPGFSRDEPYILLDGRGLMVGGGTLRSHARMDISALSPGPYVLDFTRAGRSVRVVKE